MSKLRNAILTVSLLILSNGYAIEVLRPPPPEKIQKEIERTQHEISTAEKMFVPWYTGPLLTGSANNAQPGQFVVQPYLFVTNTYANYDGNRNSRSIPNFISYKPLLILQTGITKWLDITLTLQGLHNRQSGHSSTNFADTSVQLGFQIVKQKPYVPSIRATLTESFPTGKYENLSSSKGGVDSTGSGAFETTFGINFSKIYWWFPQHPINLRLSLNYLIPANVNVKGFNTYGGGFGTKGTVSPPNTFAAGFGAEFSLSEKWVLATDLSYFTSERITFSGKSGKNSSGMKAHTGAPSSDQLSIAPAIEYNVTSNIGIIGGVWFSVLGRNSSDFVSGILSVVYVF